MASKAEPTRSPCNPACTKIVKFMTDHELPPSIGISLPPVTVVQPPRRRRFAAPG